MDLIRIVFQRILGHPLILLFLIQKRDQKNLLIEVDFIAEKKRKNKGVKKSAFVETTANMESYGVSFSSHRKTLWRQLQNYELDHQLVTLL